MPEKKFTETFSAQKPQKNWFFLRID